MKQLCLHSDFKKSISKSFGGEHLRGKRKNKRPLSLKRPLHLVLRSDVSIKNSFIYEFDYIERMIEKFSKRFGVKVYERAINSNHLHLIIKFGTRESYAYFVRALAGALARKLSFKWVSRPFTRVVLWGQDFLCAKKYVIQNQMEAWGLIEYRPRKSRFCRLRLLR